MSDVVHAGPRDDEGYTPCCNRTPFELGRGSRITYEPDLVTCGKRVPVFGGTIPASVDHPYHVHSAVPATLQSVPATHRPTRGSDVEKWILTHRNDYFMDLRTLNDLLEDYRTRADEGRTLSDE